MKIIKAKNIHQITQADFENLIQNYSQIILDIGTGDGKFVYKQALENKDIFYIGLDPSYKQMQTFSKKVNKNKLLNCIFVLGSIEMLPIELKNKMDKIFINYPWGSLLLSVIVPSREIILGLYELLKARGSLEIIFGYSHDNEPKETKRLGLPKLSEEYLKNEIVRKYEMCGFKLTGFSPIVEEGHSTWAKKLLFGKPRVFYKLSFVKEQI